MANMVRQRMMQMDMRRGIKRAGSMATGSCTIAAASGPHGLVLRGIMPSFVTQHKTQRHQSAECADALWVNAGGEPRDEMWRLCGIEYMHTPHALQS